MKTKEMKDKYQKEKLRPNDELNFKNLYIGKCYHYITVTDLYSKIIKNKKQTYAIGVCKCGNTIDKRFAQIKFGSIKSCGCYNLEKILEKGNHYNKEFFKTYSKERNYFLGLIFSDGNLDYKTKRITLNLQERDRDILFKLNKLISDKNLIKKKIIKQKGQNQFLLRICCKEIYEDLIKLGLYPNKSLTLTIPDELKNCSHFWRGMIDGDGHINSKKRKVNYLLTVGICGTKDVCSKFKEFCLTISPDIRNKITYEPSLTNDNFARFKIHGKNALMVCSKLYSDCNNLFITRKFDIFNYFLSNYKNNLSRSEINSLSNKNKIYYKKPKVTKEKLHFNKTINKTGYKGVILRKDGRYNSVIIVNKKTKHIGSFGTALEAAVAYNEKSLEIYGEKAYLNNIKNELSDKKENS